MTHSPAPSSSSASTPFLTRSVSPNANDNNHEVDLDIDDDLESSSPTLSNSGSPPPYHREKFSRRRASSPSSPLSSIARRPRILAIAGILAFLVIFAVFSVVRVSNGEEAVSAVLEADTEKDEQQTDSYPAQVRGPPTESFKDNLRDDVQYITSWISAGWTNDFMTYANLLYLAFLTNRTAVLPPFAPSHIGSSAGFVDVGDVFDLPRLSKAMGIPIIQWSDIKLPSSEHVDELGCWSIWATAATKPEEQKPRHNVIEPHLSLDVSYTPVPSSAVMLPRPQFSSDPHTRFSSLAALTFPDGRDRAGLPSAASFPGPQSGHTTLPDEQMSCFDFPYYVASEAVYEFNYDWSPAWRFVGTHAHWTPWLTNVAKDAIRQTFKLEEGEEVPPFISLHVRHGDFGRYCQWMPNPSEEGECFAPLSTYANFVDEVKQELREKKGIEVERVLVTSDESDEKWWDEVRELGWEWVDHKALGTEERFGKWYTIFVDAVVQSLGAGFVGTDRSTMSLVAQRRVEDWNEGATREVKWGAFAKTKREWLL